MKVVGVINPPKISGGIYATVDPRVLYLMEDGSIRWQITWDQHNEFVAEQQAHWDLTGRSKHFDQVVD